MWYDYGLKNHALLSTETLVLGTLISTYPHTLKATIGQTGDIRIIVQPAARIYHRRTRLGSTQTLLRLPHFQNIYDDEAEGAIDIFNRHLILSCNAASSVSPRARWGRLGLCRGRR